MTHFEHAVLLNWQPSRQQYSHTMPKRPLYLLASMLFLASLLTGIAAQTSASKAAKFAALAASVNGDEDRQLFLTLSRFNRAEHSSIATTSLAVFVGGVTAWILSRRRRECGLQSVPLVLAFLAVVIQLLLV